MVRVWDCCCDDYILADIVRLIACSLMSSESNFEGADFSNAIVDRASFTGSSLRGAIFANAVLTGTSFDDANVENADFTDAYIGGE
jgi:uncharacterized protein YjbI with pentapeptide repeats